MITQTSQSGHVAYGLRTFVLDTADDLENLPVDILPGSEAFCIATSKTYMMNSAGEWTEITK